MCGHTKPISQTRNWLPFALLLSTVVACVTAGPVNPPESYKGPVAQVPLVQADDYWVYEMGNQSRAKTTKLMANIGFPLWIGKNWSFEGEALPAGQPVESKANRIPTRISCAAVGYSDVSVQAGTFKAFECECECKVLGHGYEPYCGDWKFWYAPDVKNLVKQHGESTKNSFELTDYRGRRPPPAKAAPRKTI